MFDKIGETDYAVYISDYFAWRSLGCDHVPMCYCLHFTSFF